MRNTWAYEFQGDNADSVEKVRRDKRSQFDTQPRVISVRRSARRLQSTHCELQTTRIQMNESIFPKGGFMKKLMMTAVVLFGVFGLQRAASADGGSKLVEIRVSDAIIPGGFNSNTEAYIIETGLFPNGCYSWAYANVTHLENNLTQVESFATVRSGMCPMVMIPYHKEVNLGKLTTGVHTIRFMNSDGTYLDEHMTIE